jgi:hypothetical protein
VSSVVRIKSTTEDTGDTEKYLPTLDPGTG